MTRFHRVENIHNMQYECSLDMEEIAYYEASVSNYLVFKYLSRHVLITSEIRIVKPVGHPLIIDVALLKARILVHTLYVSTLYLFHFVYFMRFDVYIHIPGETCLFIYVEET